MIHKISKLYLKKYCNELINYFEDNITKATKGHAGNNEINNLEISIDINNFNLGAALNFGIQNFKNKYKTNKRFKKEKKFRYRLDE